MNAVKTWSQHRLVLDGTHPDISVTLSQGRQLAKVMVRPVPAELEGFIFGDREQTVIYDGPLAEAEGIEFEVHYAYALLAAGGGLVKAVLTAPLPKEVDRPGSERILRGDGSPGVSEQSPRVSASVR